MQVAEDLFVSGGELAALGDGAFGGAHGDQVQPFEFVAEVAPGVAGLELGDAQQQEREPDQLHVGLDAGLRVVMDGAQVDGGLDVAETSLGFVERLVAFGDVGRGEGLV